MMLGPFEGKGRFRGGICTVVNALLEQKPQMQECGVELLPFDTCRIQRENKTAGKLNLSNIRNFFKLLGDEIVYIREQKPDVFYLHSSVGLALLKDLLELRKAKKKTGIKTVLHIHFAEVEKIFTGIKPLDRWMLSAIGTYVDSLVLLSRQTLEQFVELGIPREKCHLLYNFASVSFTEQELQEKQSREERKLLFVGSIDERKGIYDLLTVLQQVDKPYRLRVCGGFENDQAKERFEALAKGLEDKVVFLGFVDGEEKRKVFLDTDVLLLPSYGEGLPMVILEAMEAGCGVITTDVGAIPEIVRPENGVIIQPGDLEALRKSIEEYLTMDGAQLQQQQLRNHKAAAAYTLTVFAEKLAEIAKTAARA